MILYEHRDGTLHWSFFGGLSASLSNGRKVRAPRWFRRRFREVHHLLKQAGHDPIADPARHEAFWDWVIDVLSSPPNGLAHLAYFEVPPSETAEDLLRMFQIDEEDISRTER